jgi:hypothetical protein
MENVDDTNPTDKSAKRKRERKAYLRHAEEAWRNQLAQRGITPGHEDFEREMARGMRIEAEHFDYSTSRAARRSRAKRDAALALMNQRRQIDADLLFRLLPQLAPHDFDFVAGVLDMDRVDLAGWAMLDDLRPAVEALLGRPPSHESA